MRVCGADGRRPLRTRRTRPVRTGWARARRARPGGGIPSLKPPRRVTRLLDSALVSSQESLPPSFRALHSLPVPVPRTCSPFSSQSLSLPVCLPREGGGGRLTLGSLHSLTHTELILHAKSSLALVRTGPNNRKTVHRIYYCSVNDSPPPLVRNRQTASAASICAPLSSSSCTMTGLPETAAIMRAVVATCTGQGARQHERAKSCPNGGGGLSYPSIACLTGPACEFNKLLLVIVCTRGQPPVRLPDRRCGAAHTPLH